MANNIQLKFDIDNKAVDIASGKVLSLTEQIKILKKELQKGGYSQEQIQILSSSLGDLEDQYAKVKTKAGDFLTTLQLIPGPIGEIASKLNGTIALLKTFSGFKLSDLKFQFSETINDVKEIGQWLGKATGITKVYTTINNALAASFVKVGVGEAAAATGARAFAAALTATGVGALIVGLGLAVNALMNFADNSDEAAAAQKRLDDQIKQTTRAIDDQIQSITDETDILVLQAKKRGASIQEVQKIREDGLRKQIALDQQELSSRGKLQSDLAKIELDANLSDEQRAEKRNKITEERNKIQARLATNQVALNKLILEGEIAVQEEANKKKEKLSDNEIKQREKKLQEKKDQLDAEIQLEINKGNTDKAVLEKLLADRLALEGKKGNVLKLAQQQNTKTVTDALEADKKVDEERIKNTEEFNRKIRDLKTSAIVNEVEREKQARLDKFNDDIAALEKDKEFIKKSEEEKAEIRKNVKIAYDNDINKINETQTQKEKEEDLKRLDAKLRILELQGQSLLQGTRAYFDNRAAILAETENKELQQLKADFEAKKLTQEEYEKAVTATAKKYGEARKQLKQEEVAAIGKIVSASIDAVAGLTAAIASSYDEEAKTSKEAFEKRKKLQVATALMSAASGIVQILTQPSVLPSPLDWIVKGVNAAALAVATGVNISKIKKTQFEAPDAGNQQRRKLASGGYVSGPGTSTSDSIPASLSNGEFVMNARSTSAFLPMLTAMNNAGNQARFAAGGLVTPNIGSLTTDNITQAIATGMDRPIKTYVVGQDMSNQQQFDRAIKSRSTI